MTIEIIKNCPSCSSKLDRVKDQLFCRSNTCGDKQRKQVQGFAQKVKIKGLGPVSIKKLSLINIQGIYDLTEKEIIDNIGEALGTKLIREIEKAKSVSFGTFLSACSIPLVGTTLGRKVDTLTNNPNEITYDKLKDIGIGDKASTNLIKWLEEDYKDMNLPITFKEVEEKIETTMKVCITGRLNGYTKASATELLNTYGAQVVSTVNQADVLLLNERKGSAKEKQAEKLDKTILTMDELLIKLENIK